MHELRSEGPWRRHLEFEPEEARLLGLSQEGRKSLRDLDAQVDFYRELCDLSERDVGTSLRRLARLTVRRHDRGDERAELERMLLPRLLLMPDAAGYVDECAALLRESARRGQPPAQELALHFAEVEVPRILERATHPEKDAWLRMKAVLTGDVLPAASELGDGRWRLGADEYAWRLANMGLAESPAELLRAARATLEAQRAAIAELLDAPTFADALPAMQARFAQRLSAGAVRSAYAEANARCVEFVRRQRIFELPDDFEVPLSVVPPEMSAVTHAGNVPAPLFGTGGGSFAVLDDPERHRAAWVAPLAIHEGVPGHYLQSHVWQRTFRARGVAPEFVSFADPIAAARQDWGAMPAIEGWAVHAEELMRAAGFHGPDQELAVRTFHAIRCARACIDIGLHVDGMSLDEAATLLREGVGLDREDADREILRCMRVPTQPTTYFAGWRAIERLVRDSGLPRSEAHRRLLAHGPVLPRTLG